MTIRKKRESASNPFIGTRFDAWLKSELRDAEFRRLYKQELASLRMGDRLREKAESCGLSVRRLAKRMRTSPSQVQRLFSEDATKCSLETLIRFSVATGCTLVELIEVRKAA